MGQSNEERLPSNTRMVTFSPAEELKRDEVTRNLIHMGFESTEIQRALDASSNDPNHAYDILCTVS